MEKPICVLKPIMRPRRVWAPFDAFVYNLMAINPIIMFLIPLLMAVMVYPRGNFPAAVLVAGAFCVAQAVVYVFLASTMPRNGGDYYFQSRLLSSGAGAVFAFTPMVLGGAMWMAIAGWIAANVVVGPAFDVVGRLTGLTFCLRLAAVIESRSGVFVSSIVIILWSAMVILRGMRFYAFLQRALFFAAVGSTILLLFFVASAGKLASGPAFHEAALKATQLGWRPQSDTGLRGILALIPLPTFALIYCAWSVQQGGEIKEAASLATQLVTILGALLFASASVAGIAWLVLSRYGAQALGAAAFLFLRHPEQLPVHVLPFYWVNLTHLWPGGVAALALVVVLNSWFWMWVPNTTLAASRVIVAMASDRLLPRSLAQTSAQNGVLTRATIVFSAFCVVPALVYSYTSFPRLALDATLVDIVAFAVTCGIAVAFPFAKREVYRESSASPYEVLGVPVISLAGATFVVFALFVIGRYIGDAGLALGIGPYFSHVVVAVLYAASFGLYLARRLYRRAREGSEIELLYDQSKDI